MIGKGKTGLMDAKTGGGAPFRVWVFGDAHVGTDQLHHRESLADAIRQSECGGKDGGSSFEWDIAIDVGDMSGGQAVPEDKEGREVVRQLAALEKHKREHIYHLCGNHDRSGLREPEAWWWQKWVDPLGEHTAHSGVHAERRPYAIEGTWERYAFQAGNIRFLLMSDVNEPSQTIGRGDLGGNPGGVVKGDTFAWWKEQLAAYADDHIVVSAHHYVLKDTTVASGDWEGLRKNADGDWVSYYHGYKKLGTPQGASYLYWVNSKPDSAAFESILKANPGGCDIWLGGHTHTHPDDRHGGKGYLETKWGTHFINCAALTRHHGVAEKQTPSSRLLTFTPGSEYVRVQYYLHTNHYAPQGWYPSAERVLKLSRAFAWS